MIRPTVLVGGARRTAMRRRVRTVLLKSFKLIKAARKIAVSVYYPTVVHFPERRAPLFAENAVKQRSRSTFRFIQPQRALSIRPALAAVGVAGAAGELVIRSRGASRAGRADRP